MARIPTIPAAGLALCASVAAGAVKSAPAEPGEQEDYAFLVKHMPDKDRGTVGEDYLRKNVRLARQAWLEAPWRDSVPREVYLEYILPYSSIGEEVDDFRPMFRESLR